MKTIILLGLLGLTLTADILDDAILYWSDTTVPAVKERYNIKPTSKTYLDLPTKTVEKARKACKTKQYIITITEVQ